MFEQMLNVEQKMVIIRIVNVKQKKEFGKELFFHPGGTQNVYPGHKTSYDGSGVLGVVL